MDDDHSITGALSLVPDPSAVQAADLICTVELLAAKHQKDIPLNKSEEFFFGKWRDLKKKYLAPLRRLSI